MYLNTFSSFTARSTVASWNEEGDRALDDLPACAMDAAMKPILGRLEAEDDAACASRRTPACLPGQPVWAPQFLLPAEIHRLEALMLVISNPVQYLRARVERSRH